MKTYKELEREAYMAGNTELAKAYAIAEDNDGDDYEDILQQLAEKDAEIDELHSRLDEIANIAGY
jgi:hypothetical protein